MGYKLAYVHALTWGFCTKNWKKIRQQLVQTLQYSRVRDSWNGSTGSALTLSRKLSRRKDNKYWPFIKAETSDGEPVFRYCYGSPKRFNYLMIFLAASFTTVVGTYSGWSSQITTITLILMLYSMVMFCVHIQRRMLEIEGDGENYYFYIGHQMMYKGNVRDMYVRLRREKCTSGINYFYLVLNGFHVEEVAITSFSENYKEFKRHGKRIAYQLNLNYLDFDEISCEHAVRHMINYENFCESRMHYASTAEMGKRMTDAARSAYGVGHETNILHDPIFRDAEDEPNSEKVRQSIKSLAHRRRSTYTHADSMF